MRGFPRPIPTRPDLAARFAIDLILVGALTAAALALIAAYGGAP